MEKCVQKTGLFGSGSYLLPAAIVFITSLGFASVSEARSAQAIPDYGSDDCVSFKHGSDINPLNFSFGYACVSEHYCEVSVHGCIDSACQHTDYSRGARTTLTNISITSRISEISMGAAGKDLASNAQWCLVQDGAGNFWALDRQRGSSESFSLHNQHKTIVPCKITDYFRNDLGCVAGNSL